MVKKKSRVDRTKGFCRKRKLDPKKCHKESFRVVSPNEDTRITVCCPKKEWMPRKKRCKVGLKTQGIAKKHHGKSCKKVMKNVKR